MVAFRAAVYYCGIFLAHSVTNWRDWSPRIFTDHCRHLDGPTGLSPADCSQGWQ